METPKALTRYDVEADWLLLFTCNFRCSYCFFDHKELGSKLEEHGSVKQWVDGFDATGKRWLIHITGGEPTLYPGFVDLCEGLTKNHLITLNSNFSNNDILNFGERVDPTRVEFINAALHYDERIAKKKFTDFIVKVQELKHKGFNVLISVVMTPAMIKEYWEVEKRLNIYGLSGVPKSLRGTFLHGCYPEAYTEYEKQFIEHALDVSLEKHKDVLKAIGADATLNMFASDRKFVRGIPNYNGRHCGIGKYMVSIDPQGDVKTCNWQSSETLGNIIQQNVRLLEAPVVCANEFCPHYCEKYTKPEYTTGG